ncbi:hypothetical protein GCM10010401_04560 [Rarobacter faecitabidus]|uniref:Uncharacterized protein DUF4229 n=1 Tax=Rarobacter faecitabidus TaxID=13243 RepID=A0A542ZU26_RARFA|nr:DUF4229 domain-containing protein [Rarobacter faecitabidus]TQL63789.1 uncharacterized protein DUF4229 [Rarobacter faecitabidus]
MPFVLYSAYRIALVFISVIVLYQFGMRGWLLWVWAVVLALLISYAVLGRPREQASQYLAQRRQRRKAGHRFSEKDESYFAEEDEAIERSATIELAKQDVPTKDAAEGLGGEEQAEAE